MKPPPLRYERAESLAAALELLSQDSELTKPLAGGQSLVPLLNLRLARPEMVLDIARLSELDSIERTNGTLVVGAVTTQARLEADEAAMDACPLLAEGLRWLAHPPVRQRGTVGGSIAHADPAAELPLVLVALGGSVGLRSVRGERSVAADEFFRGFLETAAEPDELVTAVHFPVREPGAGYAFEEFARRPGDFALVAVAVAARASGEGSAALRVAIGGVGPAPVLLELGNELSGAGTDERAGAAMDAADAAISPVSDVHGSEAYRRALTRELVRRAVVRATGGP